MNSLLELLSLTKDSTIDLSLKRCISMVANHPNKLHMLRKRIFHFGYQKNILILGKWEDLGPFLEVRDNFKLSESGHVTNHFIALDLESSNI